MFDYQLKEEFESNEIIFQVPASFAQYTAFGKTYRNLLPTRELPVIEVNGKKTIEYDLEIDRHFNIIGANYFFSIELKKEEQEWYQYAIIIDAFCPHFFDGLMFSFIDTNADVYRLFIHDHSRKKHTLRFNSSSPVIKVIQWTLYNNKDI